MRIHRDSINPRERHLGLRFKKMWMITEELRLHPSIDGAGG